MLIIHVSLSVIECYTIILLTYIIVHCRDIGVRELCYYYFPPCGNVTHFEPPSSLCESACRCFVDNICQQEWIQALQFFSNHADFLMRIQIDVMNCSRVDFTFQQLPHCCSDAGIEEYTQGELLRAHTHTHAHTHILTHSVSHMLR